MEFHDDEPDHNTFVHEEKLSFPGRLSFAAHESVHEHNVQFASARNSTSSARHSSAAATSIPLSPMSPKTPWLLSPQCMSPSPVLCNCSATLHRPEGNIFSISVSKHLIFTGSESNRVHAWKQPEGTEMGYIKASYGQVRAILACGRTLFTSHGDHKVRVWDVSLTEDFRAKKLTTLPPRRPFFFQKKRVRQHRDHISCLAYSEVDKILYTGSWDRTVKAWKVSESCCIDSFGAHDGHVNGIVINQEDGSIFSCSADGSIKIWRRLFGENTHILTMTLKFQLSPVNALALSLSSCSCFLYSGSSDGLINFWQKEKLSSRYNHGGFLQGHHFAVLCLAATEDLVFSGSEDATIRVWRREEENGFHSCLSVIEGHRGPVRCLAISLEMDNEVKGLLLFSASLDLTFKVWRLKVFPTEKPSVESSANYQKMEIEMNPVLSPSWVEKKLQCNYVQ